MSKCLKCYLEIENENENEKIDFLYHRKCSNILFSTPTPPELEINLSEFREKAKLMLKNKMTLTGVQEKISASIKKSHPHGHKITLVSTLPNFILKLPSQRFNHLPEFEDLTMKLARNCGLKIVEHGLIPLKSGELAFITKRFDRFKNKKIHVEDFAQLTETLTENKYLGSLELILNNIKKYCSSPGNDTYRFLELNVFCFLVGNSDMHLKNYSLIRHNGDFVELTPFYDLVPVKIILKRDNEETALTIKGKKKNITYNDFLYLAEYSGLDKKLMANMISEIIEKLNDQFDLINRSFLSKGEKEKFILLISERTKRLRK
jgi:serine/threonine-protein kinase HipA